MSASLRTGSSSSARCAAGSRQAHHLLLRPVPHPTRHQLVHRVQVARTETVTETQTQQQPKSTSSWAPWKVLNPFKGRTQQKQQQEVIPTISEAELWQLLEGEQTVPLVVIFSATWCGPCKIMMARLESLLKTLGPSGMRAVKIDTDDCPDLASELKVHKLPTMYFIGPDATKPAAHFTGLMPESVIQDMAQNRSKFLGTDIRKALSI